MEIRMRKEEGGVALELHGLKVDEALALAGSFLEGCDKILKVAKFVSVHPELGARLKEIDRKKLELKSDAELQELNDEALRREDQGDDRVPDEVRGVQAKKERKAPGAPARDKAAHSWGAEGFVEHVKMVYGSLPAPETILAQSLRKEYDNLEKSGTWE